MKKLKDEIIQFFHKQNLVIVSTISPDGSLHNSCKGIIKINQNGKIYLLDLYKGQTFSNLERNPRISITAVDEHKFKGYCLTGKARIIGGQKVPSGIISSWEDRIISRITQRVIKNLGGQQGHPRHPEALLPRPEYLVVMEVENIIDLTPHHLKQGV